MFQSEAEPVLHTSSGASLYRVTHHSDCDSPAEQPSSVGVEPGTGAVFYVLPPGEVWFANSSVDLWLRTLHRYGRHATASQLLREPDEPEECFSDEGEERALAELARLAEESRRSIQQLSRATSGSSGQSSSTGGSTRACLEF